MSKNVFLVWWNLIERSKIVKKKFNANEQFGRKKFKCLFALNYKNTKYISLHIVITINLFFIIELAAVSKSFIAINIT